MTYTYTPLAIRVACGLMLLLAATAWLLWPGVQGPFLFDDTPNFQNLSQLACQFDRLSLGTYLSVFTGTPGRPLAALSFLLNDCDWPSNPHAFKVANLLLHLLAGVMAFGLARALARIHGCRQPEWIALATAAIWLLSPIQVSAVFLTVQRMTLLAGLFAFAGLWAYVVLVDRMRSGIGALAAVAALGTGTVLAFLCKENGALTPLLALVLNATLLRPVLQAHAAWPRRLIWGAPAAATVLLMLVLASQWDAIANFSGRPFSQVERLLTQGRVLLDYLGLIIAPQLSSSGLYNDDYAISHGWLDPAGTLLAWLAIIAALVVAIVLRRRWPLPAFAILWFLAGHALESSVLSLELYFEHRNYVSLFGIAFAIVATAADLQGKLRRPVLIGLAAWLVLAGAITHLQARVWGNWQALSTIWRVEHPRSQRAQQQYADFLYAIGEERAARQVFVEALQLGVAPLDSRLQILHLDCLAGKPVAPTLLDKIRHDLGTGALSYGTSGTLVALRKSVQAQQCPQAIDARTWLQLTQLALDNPRGKGLQRALRMERGYLFVESGDLDRGIPELEAAWSLGHEPRIAFYAAAVLATAGRHAEARSWAARPLTRKRSAWKNWLSQSDRQAWHLIRAIDQSRKQADDARRRPGQ